MHIRGTLLYINYLIQKIIKRKLIIFHGFTIFYAFPNSSIEVTKGEIKTVFNSSFFSNMLGLYQRCIVVARHGGKITIGSGCGISGSTIYSMSEITIGNNVLIGANCKIIDNDFHSLDASKRINQQPDDIPKKPIKIGDDCFIGANSIILKGTQLGKNCVVGAGSVVSGIFPDNVIIAGNPAIIKKYIINQN